MQYNQKLKNNQHQQEFIKLFSQSSYNSKPQQHKEYGKQIINSNRDVLQSQRSTPKKEEPVIAGSIQQISQRKADEFTLEKPAARRVTYGMRNLGNTCFFNSVMQCLTHTKALFNYCLSEIHTKDCKKSQGCFLCLYTMFLKTIQQQQKTNPQIVVHRLKQIWQRYSLGRQEDAHEFLIIFMESLVNSCFQMAKPPREFIYKNQNKTAVFQLIGGKSRSQVKCLGCGHCSNTYEDLISLSLEFPKKRQIGSCTLEECLQNFYAPEMLKGDNKYMCGGCKKRQEAKKRFSIESTPRSLVIHLKRFTNMGNKIGEFVRYPATLSLKNFLSSTIDSGEKSSIENELFDLYGVVVHQGGGCRSGHYFSFCKGFDGEWYDCNDDYVGRSMLDKILRQQAYILFYQKRINPSKLTGLEILTEEVTKPIPTPNPELAKPKIVSQEDQQKPNNLPGVIVTSKPKVFKEDGNKQTMSDILKNNSLSAQSTASSNNLIDYQPEQLRKPSLTEDPKPELKSKEQPKPQEAPIEKLVLRITKTETLNENIVENSEQPEVQEPQPPTKKLLTAELKQEKDEVITLRKPAAFTNLRRDLHPLSNTLNAKKRKLEAVMELIKMPQRKAALLRRFNCNINPRYLAPADSNQPQKIKAVSS